MIGGQTETFAQPYLGASRASRSAERRTLPASSRSGMSTYS
jgi:hypothetical protein